jgi:hypothetical protein
VQAGDGCAALTVHQRDVFPKRAEQDGSLDRLDGDAPLMKLQSESFIRCGECALHAGPFQKHPLYSLQVTGAMFLPGQQSTFFPLATLGLVYWGKDAAVPDKYGYGDKFRNFAPRFGFAYDPIGDGKSSFRGSYGIFYTVRAAEYGRRRSRLCARSQHYAGTGRPGKSVFQHRRESISVHRAAGLNRDTPAAFFPVARS